ncbi:MAG: hypothetical protein QM767_00970 [Anaeromyxobacter sp.]
MPFAAIALAAALAAPVAPPQENLLRGPARCVLRYLEAVRLAGPRAAELRPAPGRGRAAPIPDRPQAYAAANRLLAPRALEAAARPGGSGAPHPLAPWTEAAGGAVLESFQLQGVRRAPRGAAVVTVRERWWRPGPEDGELARSVSEILVARVDGEWRVIDRRPGRTFRDAEIADGYAGWFDEAGPPRARPVPSAAPGR